MAENERQYSQGSVKRIMKKHAIYIFVLIGFIFMASAAVYLISSAFNLDKTVSIISGILFILSLCGIYFFQWKARLIFKNTAANEKELKALKYLEVTKKVWILLILFCMAAIILKL